MPKKPQQQQLTESRLIAWYKWEFLRRNHEYLRNYKEFISEFGVWFRQHGYWYDQNIRWKPSEFRFFAKVIAPRIKIICERWQIREPVPPSWSGMNYYSRPGVLIPTDCAKEEAGQGWDLSKLSESKAEFLKHLPESTAACYGPEPDYHLELQFDLRRPLDDLLREAKDAIASRKWKYNRKHPAPTTRAPEVRRRLNLYATYLKVWDLKEGGEKFEYIGALLFSKKRNPAQTAKDSFRRALQLIKG